MPKVPARYRQCAELSKLPVPKGGWTKAKAIEALGTLQVSEVEKADCINDLADWSDQQLNSLRGNNGL